MIVLTQHHDTLAAERDVRCIARRRVDADHCDAARHKALLRQR
jgi:hypothetical protein